MKFFKKTCEYFPKLLLLLRGVRREEIQRKTCGTNHLLLVMIPRVISDSCGVGKLAGNIGHARGASMSVKSEVDDCLQSVVVVCVYLEMDCV